MINFIKKIARYTLIAMFFSFYVVAILINYKYIDHYIKPLELFDLKKEYKVDANYIATFPDKKELKEYKQRYHIQRVIALLDFKSPILKELLKEEKAVCKSLGIELIYVDISLLNPNPMDYNIVLRLLEEEPKKTLFHSYWFDKRMSMLKEILKVYGKTP